MLAPESEVLHIPVSDASTHKQARVLGADLLAGEYMYTELHNAYQSVSDESVYDHIPERKYVLSFPTSTADIENLYNDSKQQQSYRWTLLTSDIESDYEDIADWFQAVVV